jgi:hypothetical protein
VAALAVLRQVEAVDMEEIDLTFVEEHPVYVQFDLAGEQGGADDRDKEEVPRQVIILIEYHTILIEYHIILIWY